MSFVPATCPSCGGNLQVPDDRDQVKCMYCGGDIIVRQAITLAAGVNVGNLIQLAEAAAAASNYKEAYDYYTKSLEYDPTNATSWVGKGKAAGWMSKVNDLKLQEMTAGFDAAIKYTPDPLKQSMRENCAVMTNDVAAACYSIVRQHCLQFVQLDNTWPNYLAQCLIIINALETAHSYDPNNTIVIQGIINIYQANIQGLNFKAFDGSSRIVFLLPGYEAVARNKIREYSAKMQRFNPSFQEPQAQKPSLFCFVATATLGEVNHPAVIQLRQFRDAWLLKRRVGRLFVRFYSLTGPHLARFIRKSPLRRQLSFLLIIRPALRFSSFLTKRSN